MKLQRLGAWTAAAVVIFIGTVPLAAAPDSAMWEGMAARSIGPAGMSGRIADIAAVSADPSVVWVGAATGGVWKSVNGGLTWRPVFDDQPVASIGGIAIFQPNPDLVWVGTGEAQPRNSISVGRGVFRTRDGGEHWEQVGLEATERIARVITHPTDPDVVWVAALGRAWGENPERGVYKTDDGGTTWRKVLYVDERTGCADLVLDPTNPDKLIAAMWDYRRWPWSFRSGGPGSGVYVSQDGGENWDRRTPEDGLPEGDLGRIGLAIAPSDSDVVYALVEAKKNVMLRSTDGGATFKDTGASRDFGNRPFYFADLRVDPQRPNRVYSLWSVISVSEDGATTWRVLAPWQRVHPDHHAMWIDPGDGRKLIVGNDGGVAFSEDRGATWRFVANLPLAQYYHIRVDDDVPYHVYGGMQDNGSWRGPAEVWENGGIRNLHWDEVGFGDGFDTIPDPRDSMRGYAMSQEGFLIRWDLHTGERKSVRPAPPPGETLRFNWNAAIAIDPFDPAHLWFGSQFVHETHDSGETWTVISPDLTTNTPEWQKQADSGGLTKDVTGAENFTTIVAIAPSPTERGVLWVGSDDGRVHVTRDAGATWISVEKNARGVPDATWVPQITPSRHRDGSAWIVFDNHRRSDWTTYVYEATEYGKRWRRVGTAGVDGYALTLAEDPQDPDLLWLGTEFGLWISFDRGATWSKWDRGVPTVSVMALAVQAADDDLVIGTHGRGAFVIDELGPLREWKAEIADEPLHLFDVPDAQQYVVRQTGASRFPGDGEFRGANEPYGAPISFWVGLTDVPHPDDEAERARKAAERRAAADAPAPTSDDQADEAEKEDRNKVTIRILDASGAVVRAFRRDAHQGLNRVVWNLRHDEFRGPVDPTDPVSESDGSGDGPEMPPGQYTVELELRDRNARDSFRVLADPRTSISDTDRQANWKAVERIGRLRERLRDGVERIRRLRSDIDLVMGKAEARWDVKRLRARGDALPEAYERLEASAKALRKRLDEAERDLWSPPEEQGIVADTHALGQVGRASWVVGSTWARPTPAQERYVELAEQATDRALGALDTAIDEAGGEFAGLARDEGFGLFSEVGVEERR